MAAADDLEQECERLQQQWQQRLERAAQQVDRAARQFHAVEPENRLVARTLEKNWEVALQEQGRLLQEYEVFQRQQLRQLSDEQRELIRHLSEDIPALRSSPNSTPQDRQQITRMLIERIDLNIVGNSEQTEIVITWSGEFQSRHHFARTVISYNQLSNTDALVAHIVELKEQGMNLHQVADRLNQEGWRSLRGGLFTNHILSRLLVKRGLHLPRGARTDADQLEEDEWWLCDLARELNMPRTTLNHWLKQGYLMGRKLAGIRGRWIVKVDEEELARLNQLRQTRRRWSDQPYPTSLTTPKQPSVNK